MLTGGCKKQPPASQETPSTAPRGALELVFPYGSEKEKWINDVTAAFNRSGVKTQNGKTIFVRALPMGSGETIDNILSGRLQAHIASPASAAFIKLGNAESRTKTGKDLIGNTDNLVLSPVVIAMWKPMAEAIGWGKKPLGWADILALSRKDKGWDAYGFPQWGKFKFGHTHPEYSNSGLISLFAEAYAASGKTAGLSLSDLEKPQTKQFIAGVEQSVVHYGSSTGFFGRKMFTNGTAALPKGYLLCGPVGTGKTFLVECLAGEACVPIVKMKNFRDKRVGSSEGNLEKIFRLIHALGRCYVFIDEADQALGRRDSSSGDSGVGGRIYSMLAEEMGSSTNRGKVIWVLASSRPDLIEVDLKRPGRVDVKIPLFPTTTAREGFDLIRVLCGKRGIVIPESSFEPLEARIPPLLTPGAAEALAVKIYRQVRTGACKADEVLAQCLSEYQSPIAPEVMAFQIQIAANEATDLEFVPPIFRRK